MHEHTGFDFDRINDLPYDKYLRLRRDAYIYRLNLTESGREYLKKCWILEQTQPDRQRLREQFGRKGTE